MLYYSHSTLELPFIKIRETMIRYGIIRYSHSTLELPFIKIRETMIRYGIIRYSHSTFELPFNKRNDDTLWHYQVFSFDFRITF